VKTPQISDVIKVFREFEKEKGITRKMMAAVDSGDPAAVKALLTKGLSVNVQDRSGATPLMRAAVKGRTDVAKLLLDRGALVNDRDHKENTALILASELGLKDMVALLLNRGADPEMKKTAGLTALGAAKQKRQSEVAQILKDHDSLGKKLSAAVQAGDLAQAKALLDRGAPVDSADSDGTPAIVAATRGGKTDLVQLLLEKGANPNGKDAAGDTALTIACSECKLDIIKPLLMGGANSTTKNNLGYTPLKIAWDLKIDGKEECAAAFDYLKTYLSDNDPGYKLILAAELGNTKLLRELIDSGANVDTENELEETALMVASREGRVDAVKLLLQKGADTDGALVRAVDAGHVEIAKLLLNAGSEIQSDALCHASAAGNVPLVELLLEKGADVNESSANDDQYEATPLILASANGHGDVVKLLLSKGADLSLKDSEGKTALDVATASNHQQVVDLLKPQEKK
jgi:ankyrin repeat protein